MSPILRPGENCSTPFDAGESGLLIDGAAYYRAFYEAASRARRHIVIAGWQFDSEVELVRDGRDRPTRFLAFLDHLCTESPDLRVDILAWDFSMFFLFDREWMQEWIFNWTSSDRLTFRFDDRHAVWASHHEKFAVIDGALGFVGGLDFAEGHWDERDHQGGDPRRVRSSGEAYPPYHDVQACFTGPAAAALAEHFASRWAASGAGPLELPDAVTPEPLPFAPDVSIGPARITFSRTRSGGGDGKATREIRSLYSRAIRSARRLVYLETQYLTSQVVFESLLARFAEGDGPIEVLLLLPEAPETLKEAVALTIEQSRLLRALAEAARAGGHHLGVYFPRNAEGAPIYIHSKLLLVDDRFLTVGSANATNRSMGLDTELNVSWEAGQGSRQLQRRIHRVRVDLLAEHTGLRAWRDLRGLARIKGLVPRLDQLAEAGRSRLHPHLARTIFDDYPALRPLEPDRFVFDPETPLEESEAPEEFGEAKRGDFLYGLQRLKRFLTGPD